MRDSLNGFLCALARHNKPDRNHREKEYHDIPS